MAGLLTHFSIALIGSLIILLCFHKSKYKWLYAPAFFLGNLIPDLVDFGITGLKIGSLNPPIIMRNSWFQPLARFSHNFLHWFLIMVIICLIAYLLYSLKKLSKKTVYAIIIASIFFLAAIVIHLNLDFYVQEVHWWI
jgi:hypothetical protein